MLKKQDPNVLDRYLGGEKSISNLNTITEGNVSESSMAPKSQEAEALRKSVEEIIRRS